MKAVIWTKYGAPDGLQLAELPKPVPRRGEFLVRIRATAIAAGDCELRALRFSLGLRILVRLIMGPLRPRRKVLGQEFAGDVEAIGDGVTRFRVGEAVFGTTGFRFGAYAEFVALPERAGDSVVAIKPANMTYAEAATVPTGGLEALRFLRRAGALGGKRIVIVGAGGGIGLNAVQIARQLGADVTGIEGPDRQELVRSLGASRVVDYTRATVADCGGPFDVVLDVVGALSIRSALRVLRPGGVYLTTNPKLGALIRGSLGSLHRDKRLVIRGPRATVNDLEALREWVEGGQLRAVIDRSYPLEEVPEAHRYLDAGHAAGRVAIEVA